MDRRTRTAAAKARKPTVAVIGAGFSGLALARALQHLGACADVTVFEKSAGTGSLRMYGEVEVPHASEVMRQLGLADEWRALRAEAVDPSSPSSVPMQPLLAALTRSLPAGTVRSNARVTRVTAGGDGLLRCEIERGRAEGPVSARKRIGGRSRSVRVERCFVTLVPSATSNTVRRGRRS